MTASRSSSPGGDIDEGQYRIQIAETRALLAELPDGDKLIAFDRNRRALVDMAEGVRHGDEDATC